MIDSNVRELRELLIQQFPTVEIPDEIVSLELGSFEQWDSMAHFLFLMNVEAHFGISFELDKIDKLTDILSILNQINNGK